ncbi:hypothetical protein AVEN_123198-1 [Araneus ventricosus]|uniref:Uncharacterized protein n=1 Tax=Araneus ventricosus TaxID=182803 RepID=A0A4Y2GTB8_ARAVE|nr:hypothetical protein AVEN_123198-1 [Araneus ventricosus]
MFLFLKCGVVIGTMCETTRLKDALNNGNGYGTSLLIQMGNIVKHRLHALRGADVKRRTNKKKIIVQQRIPRLPLLDVFTPERGVNESYESISSLLDHAQ